MGGSWTHSDPQFVGLRQHHLQDGHEGRRLAEVAAADDVGVDVQALGVASALYAPGDVVQSSYDGGRELQGGREQEVGEDPGWC